MYLIFTADHQYYQVELHREPPHNPAKPIHNITYDTQAKMGSSASKSLKANSLKKPIALNKTQGVNLAGARPHPSPKLTQSPIQSSGIKDGYDPQSLGPDPDFAERLKKLGSVQFKDIQQQYSETNPMLGAVQSRLNVEKKSEELMEKQKNPQNHKVLIHPETITAILQSRQEGDSNAKIQEDFNLEPKVLQLLGERFSIPKIIKKEIETHEQRNSVFRKEEVEETGPVLDR